MKETCGFCHGSLHAVMPETGYDGPCLECCKPCSKCCGSGLIDNPDGQELCEGCGGWGWFGPSGLVVRIGQRATPIVHTTCNKCKHDFNEPSPKGDDGIGRTDTYFIGGKWSRDLLPGDGIGHYTMWEFTCWDCIHPG